MVKPIENVTAVPANSRRYRCISESFYIHSKALCFRGGGGGGCLLVHTSVPSTGYRGIFTMALVCTVLYCTYGRASDDGGEEQNPVSGSLCCLTHNRLQTPNPTYSGHVLCKWLLRCICMHAWVGCRLCAPSSPTNRIAPALAQLCMLPRREDRAQYCTRVHTPPCFPMAAPLLPPEYRLCPMYLPIRRSLPNQRAIVFPPLPHGGPPF